MQCEECGGTGSGTGKQVNMDLAIKETKVDWLQIIDLALEKKDWGKIYTLYSYGTVQITAQIESINFRNSDATFRITCVYPEDEYHNSFDNYSYVYYKLNNFDLEFFSNLVNKRVLYLLELIPTNRARQLASKVIYEHLKYNSNGLTNDDLKSAGLLDIYEFAIHNNCDEKVVEDITIRAEEILNQEFNRLVKEYEQNHKNYPAYMQSLYEQLSK